MGGAASTAENDDCRKRMETDWGVALVSTLIQRYEALRGADYTTMYNALAERVEASLKAGVHVVVVDSAGSDRDETVAVMQQATMMVVRQCRVSAMDPVDRESILALAGSCGQLLVLMDKVACLELVSPLTQTGRCHIVALGQAHDFSFCRQALDAGASQAYAKPLSLRKALDVLVHAGIEPNRHPTRRISSKESEARSASSVPGEACDGQVEPDAWQSASFDADGNSVLLCSAVPSDVALLVAFVPNLSSDNAVAVMSRNLLRQLNFYADVLQRTCAIMVLAVCCESREAMSQAVADMDLRFKLLSDASLVFSSSYVGVSSTKAGVVAPNPGLFYLDAARRVRAFQTKRTTNVARMTRGLDHRFLETAYATTAAISGKFAGAFSANNYIASIGQSDDMSPWHLTSFLRSCLDDDIWDALQAEAHAAAVKAMRIKVNVDALRSSESQTNNSFTSPHCDTARILLVDDSKTSADIMVRKVACLGHCVLYAPDGRAAWKQLKTFKTAIDIVITDVLMPVMDGLELLSRIKSSHKLSRVTVVLLTGMAKEAGELEEICANFGNTTVITKPCSTKTIYDIVQAHLRRLQTSSSQMS